MPEVWTKLSDKWTCFLPWDNNKDCSVQCGGQFGEQHSDAHEGYGQHWSTPPHGEAVSQEAEGILWNSQSGYQPLGKHRFNFNITMLSILRGRLQFT